MTKPRLILIADDDPHIREVVRFALENAGFTTVQAADGRETIEQFLSVRPDLVILDIVMPEMDGTEVCRQIRAHSATPIIFLSSRDEEVDRIIGLELGGDDYVTKPFSPRELVARVKAVLRRGESIDAATGPNEKKPDAKKVLTHGDLVLDLDRFEARWDGKPVALTITEFGILRTLLSYPGKVFTRDELMDPAYNYDNIVTDRTIDSHVRRVRRKFAAIGSGSYRNRPRPRVPTGAMQEGIRIMRWRPRLASVLLAVNLLIFLLPLGGIAILRLYESELIRRTETELNVQGALVASIYRTELLRHLRSNESEHVPGSQPFGLRD